MIALGKLGDARALEPLLRVLNREKVGWKWVAIEALEHLGDPRAIEDLERWSEHEHIRNQVAGALHRIRAKQRTE
jgi:HEAT repeat protein